MPVVHLVMSLYMHRQSNSSHALRSHELASVFLEVTSVVVGRRAGSPRRQEHSSIVETLWRPE